MIFKNEISTTNVLSAELHTEKHLMKRFLECNEEGFWATTTEGICTFWSPMMEKIFSLPKQQVIGNHIFEVLPFLKEIEHDRAFSQVLNGESIILENQIFHVPVAKKSGYFKARYFPLETDSGKIIGVASVIRDSTAQVLAAEELKETENRFRNMADHSPVMLWMAGTDSLCNFFNQSWLAFTGRTLNQEWGVGWTEAVHPEDFQYCMDTYIASFNERRSFEMEYRLLRHDNEYRWLLDRGVPRRTPDGMFAGFIGSCVDITEKKNLELKLMQAVRVRDEFLSIASHELKTPLSSLSLQLGMLSHLMNEKFGLPECKEQIGKVTNNARLQLIHLSELIEDLLSVSRISAGQFSLVREQTDLCIIVNEVLARMQEAANAAKCAIQVKEHGPLQGFWDARRMDQVVTNLLTNALRYGQGKPIEFEFEKIDNHAILRVRDHGTGMSPELQSQIFDKFQRGVSSKHYGGLGLGLYISNTIVNHHNGRIIVDSAQGKGSTFTVELPLNEP